MPSKPGKSQFPPKHGPNDFKCFGPPAKEDDAFEGTMIADLGCFNQDREVDSNKRYHGAVVQSTVDKSWWFYSEWTREGGGKPQFQFEPASSQDAAKSAYVKKLKSKNIKRGEWKDIKLGGETKRVLRPKINSKGQPEDLYVVRALEKRSTGLPDAANILAGEGSKIAAAKKTVKKGAKKSETAKFDTETLKLMRDMNVGVTSYARGQMEGGNVPSQPAIDEGRSILEEAKKRIAKVGNDVKDQVNDPELRDLSKLLYSRVPKVKELGAGPDSWILSQDNIMLWGQDLDAFESALATADIAEPQSDPFGGMRIAMEHLARQSTLGEFIYSWMPRATANVHGYIGSMKIRNAWKVRRLDATTPFEQSIDRIAKERAGSSARIERPERQPKTRDDLSAKDKKRYQDANVGMMFHGTRSVNVPGILRTGLRLPKQLVGVVITGAMFGGGAYFADDWKKSAGYTSMQGSYWSGGSGGVRGRQAFMFVMDVAVGTPHVAPGPRGYSGPPRGCHSVFGKAGASGVANNEWIIFDVTQQDIRYLIEFEA